MLQDTSAGADWLPADGVVWPTTGHAMNEPTAEHVTVLPHEAVDALSPRPGGVYVDGTFGGGGHTRLLALRIQPEGRIIAIDRDPATAANVAALDAAFPGTVSWVNGSYADMRAIAVRLGIDAVDGILLDLGLSSLQLADPARGFSFQHDGPLDMRFDTTRGTSARELLASADEREIARILYEYGEERESRRIARAIVRERERAPLATTRELAALIERVLPRRHDQRIHPATRTFQALRIAVNGELDEVERGLREGIALLAPGGRFAVISFHSLEDRLVKHAFADAARGCICPRDVPVCVCGRTASVRLVGKPLRAAAAEVAANPRARSAIMRVVEKLP